MNTLRKFEPSDQRPWDRVAAAHLLRRAGFAPRESEVQAALRDGLDATVARLVNGTDENPEHDELDEIGASLAIRGSIERLRGWWLLRMLRTQRPLQARMNVFWHNHFATSNAKVRSAPLMLQQLRTIERHALGRFNEMLLAISRDPAMIVWLDGDENVKGRPNENYARELLELFGLGVGNYTEHDIQEAARAFTGWHQHRGRFRLNPLEHDTGVKTVFGQSGDFGGDEIVRLTVEHPACATFIATKLLREFLCPEPSPELIDALAARLRETAFDLAATLETLLSSAAFFDPRWHRARIKSPVELVIGIARALEMRVPANLLADATSQMGQRLFEPPSVKGWDGHRAWLNSATMLVRLNTATAAATNERYAPASLLARYGVDGEDQQVRFLVDLLLDGQMPQALADATARLAGDSERGLRDVTQLLLASPEYQMA